MLFFMLLLDQLVVGELAGELAVEKLLVGLVVVVGVSAIVCFCCCCCL